MADARTADKNRAVSRAERLGCRAKREPGVGWFAGPDGRCEHVLRAPSDMRKYGPGRRVAVPTQGLLVRFSLHGDTPAGSITACAGVFLK